MAGYVTVCDTASGITGRNPNEKGRTCYDWESIRNMLIHGVEHEGGWAVAQSPILVTTITLERLRKRGYEAMLTYYEKIAPHLNEPL